MDYMAIAQLVIAFLGIVVDIVKAKKAGTSPDVGDSIGTFLNKLGTTAKIKELKGVDTASLSPLINDLFGKIHELIDDVRDDEAAPAAESK